MTQDLDLSAVDVPEFLAALDIAHVSIEQNEARFSCPYPAHSFGDKNPSAYMNLTSTAWICFSCGASGNAITFLADVKEVSRLTAKNWIAQKWAPHYAEIDDLRAFIEGMFENDDNEHQLDLPLYTVLPEHEYEKRVVDWEEERGGGRAYMIDRGFDPFYLNLFDVCYDMTTDRPCITVRDRDGGLVGFKGRAWHEGQWPKYMVLGDTDKTLAERGEVFGFRPYDAAQHVFAIDKVNEGEPIIVCEGELNCISMHQKGFGNVVAPSGSTMSAKQIYDIVHATEEVILLFDTDPSSDVSYATAKSKLLKIIDAFEPHVVVRVCEDHEGDPAELDADSLKSLVDNAKTSTLYKVLHSIA